MKIHKYGFGNTTYRKFLFKGQNERCVKCGILTRKRLRTDTDLVTTGAWYRFEPLCERCYRAIKIKEKKEWEKGRKERQNLEKQKQKRIANWKKEREELLCYEGK